MLELITDRTAEDVFYENSKGTYNYTDLNRVVGAVNYLVRLFNSYGYYPDITQPKDTPFVENEIPTETQLNAYINNIKELRRTLAVLKTTPNAPESINFIGHVEANNIEQILLDLEIILNAFNTAFLKSNQILLYSGYAIYMPTQYLQVATSDEMYVYTAESLPVYIK